jgi:hypothetical protein
VVVAEPSRWDAKGSSPERTKPDKAPPEKAAVEKVTGLAGKATKIVGLANVVATNPGHKGRRYRFFRYTGCTKDHAAAACKEFRSLNTEAKKKALEDSELCKFCFWHSVETECYSKWLG